MPSPSPGSIHQVYYVPPDSLDPQNFRTQAKPVAWRQTQGTAALPHDAEIDLTADPTNAKITSVTRGPFSHAPMAQMPELATAVEGEGAPMSEVRMLRIPELRLMAIWLHSKQGDTLIPLAPCPSVLKPGLRYTVAELAKQLSPLKAALAQHPKGTEG